MKGLFSKISSLFRITSTKVEPESVNDAAIDAQLSESGNIFTKLGQPMRDNCTHCI